MYRHACWLPTLLFFPRLFVCGLALFFSVLKSFQQSRGPATAGTSFSACLPSPSHPPLLPRHPLSSLPQPLICPYPFLAFYVLRLGDQLGANRQNATHKSTQCRVFGVKHISHSPLLLFSFALPDFTVFSDVHATPHLCRAPPVLTPTDPPPLLHKMLVVWCAGG